MLRPIKNLLTYLQKNASGSANNQTVLTEEEQQEDDINMETVTAENHFQNDQNENTVKTDFPEDSNDILTPNATNVSTPNPEDSFYIDGIPTELIVVDANTSTNSLLNQSTGSTGDPLAIDEFDADDLEDPLNSSDNHYVDLANSSSDAIDGLEPELPAPSSPSTPLQSILKKRNDKEEQSDGSDSGLGSENSTPSAHNVLVSKQPLRSNLKRRAEDVEEFVQKEKKPKRSINFDVVQVYYFPRRQGFNCVPSQGGCTLGMDKIHSSFKVFPLNDHYYEPRPINIQDAAATATSNAIAISNPSTSTAINNKTGNSSGEDSDSDEDFTEASESDMDLDNSGFLQPIPIKQRRVMLKAAGVRKIDPTEKKECRDIRTSREYCGCNCRGFCDPDTCMCSRFGIKCQVDRPSFPCKCTHDTCQNPHGRVEFNPERVRRHYIHTMMRLSLESTAGARHNTHSYFLQRSNADKDHHQNGLGHQFHQHHQPSSSTSNNFYVPDTPTHSNTVSYTHDHDQNQQQVQLAYNTYYQTPSELFNNYNLYDENAHQHQPNYSNFTNGEKVLDQVITRCDQLQDESKDIIGFSADGDVELNLNVPTPQPPPDIDEKDSMIIEEESSADKIYITLEVPKKDNDPEEIVLENTNVEDKSELVTKDDDMLEEKDILHEEKNIIVKEIGVVDKENDIVVNENDIVVNENDIVGNEINIVDKKNDIIVEEREIVDKNKDIIVAENHIVDEERVIVGEENVKEKQIIVSEVNGGEEIVCEEKTETVEENTSAGPVLNVDGEIIEETINNKLTNSVQDQEGCKEEEKKTEGKEKTSENGSKSSDHATMDTEDKSEIPKNSPEDVFEVHDETQPEVSHINHTNAINKDSEVDCKSDLSEPINGSENAQPEVQQIEEKVKQESSLEEKAEEKELPKENGHAENSENKVITSEEMSDPAEEEIKNDESISNEEFKDAVDNSRENIKDSSLEVDEDFQDAIEHPAKTNGSDPPALETPTTPSEEGQSLLKENGKTDLKLIVGQV